MSDGTNYVIEQLGLALKNAQEQYGQLVQHAQGLQEELDKLKGVKKDPAEDHAEAPA